ncbi:MAG: tetratricopeptide repeat protein [Bacteroidetes bacterium]|nr:tetratricopeptide repeat protein [Bacteroidota bacterium]
MALSSHKAVRLGLVLLALLTTVVYGNHFHNTFHFDDSHTIVNNLSIRDIHNVPVFFADGRTMSSLPSNQDYRPGLTTLNAIDFYLSGKPTPDPFVFHISIFISFIVTGLLFFMLLRHILSITSASPYNDWIALLITAFFWLHPANAETVNYIIARGDSFSTLCIVLSFVLYIKLPSLQKYYLYLLPMIIGFFVKEPAIMFVPLLFFYKLLFEREMSLREAIVRPGKAIRSLLPVLIPLLIAAGLFIFSRRMAPDTWVPGGYDRWRYLFTQPYVILHYFNNFLLPLNLVVDTDWTLVPSYTDEKVIIGLVFVTVLLVLAFITSAKKEWQPVAFGILWFFIALIPTSSIFPFAEVLNDHRTFFPYLGLFIATAATVRNLLQSKIPVMKPALRTTLLICCTTVLAGYAYGTHKRNEVWHTEESLWKDATIKAPGNSRAWMNYGNTQMAIGNFPVAEQCFEKAISLSPDYSYVHVNLGVLKAAQGKIAEAEPYFRRAIDLDPGNPECYSYYADYLLKNGRINEASEIISKGLKISPAHEHMNQLSKQLASTPQNNAVTVTIPESNDKLVQIAKWTDANPTPENYISLSLDYYNAGQYENCIKASERALQLHPGYDIAYNNICASYNELHQWDKAIEAGKKGLEFNPTNPNLKANLDASYKGKGQK